MDERHRPNNASCRLAVRDASEMPNRSHTARALTSLHVRKASCNRSDRPRRKRDLTRRAHDAPCSASRLQTVHAVPIAMQDQCFVAVANLRTCSVVQVVGAQR